VRARCQAYARDLRRRYPAMTIRNAQVFPSIIRELARYGYVELVEGKKRIPDWLLPDQVYTVWRAKYVPIWLPTLKWIHLEPLIFEISCPTIEGNESVLNYSPAADGGRRRTW
jgi:hypothetical protein